MISVQLLRWPDLLAIAINLSIMIGIGVYSARRNNSADAYFLASRSMPGWVVGVSLMATIISSMTFLAIPGFTFEKDWRYMPAHFFFFIPAMVAYFLFMPYQISLFKFKIIIFEISNKHVSRRVGNHYWNF